MDFSLIICTYQRPQPLIKLLDSVQIQEKYPNQILIIDGSLNNRTKDLLKKHNYKNLEYYQVDETNRGLTKQRNFGIEKLADFSEIVCFLDDDTVLEASYFENLISTYQKFPEAVGVGGYIINEVNWEQNSASTKADEFYFDGWKRKLGSRNNLRKKFGLLSNMNPGIMPSFSNGFSVGYLPPSGKIYPVEFFMGGVSSFRKKLFNQIRFSNYFEGYGLYEDMDFCLRASKIGQLYLNTSAQLFHYHDHSGRPNKFKYGKMVLRNGWYVWRVKYPNPSIKAQLKWHATALLLTGIRLGNAITGAKKQEAFTEAVGRMYGWGSLFFKKPGK